MPLPLENTVVCPALIGRTDYLTSFSQLITKASRGDGQLVLLTGEAGIGKSRLTEEVSKRALSTHFQVLSSHCFEPDKNLPYASLIDLLRGHWSGFTPLELKQLFTNFGDLSELGQLLPEFHQYLSENILPVRLEPQQQKRRLFRSISNYFTRLAANQPLMVIFEDIHWCDNTTFEFLLHLIHQVPSKAVLVLLTYRCDEPNLILDQFLATLDRMRIGHEFMLSPLSRVEIGEMHLQIFKLNQPVQPEFLELLHSLSEGNPFFVEEILRSLLIASAQSKSDIKWEKKPLQELHIPRSILEVVQRRSRQLSPKAQELLALAAVVGRSFDFELLLKLSGESEQTLLKLVREVLEAQLILEKAPEHLVFRHALVREAIYKQLLGRERKNLHQRIGQMLEELHQPDLESYLTDLTYHFFEAGEWLKAYEYAWKAAIRAQALYAPRAAVEYFEQVFISAARAGVSNTREVYRLRGKAFETLGEFEPARADYEQALKLSQKDLTRVNEWQALLDLGMLWVGRDYNQAGEYYQQAFNLATQIEDQVCLAYSLNCLGNWYLNNEEPQEARRCHQEAMGIFQSLNNPEGLAETLDLLGMTCCLGGDLVLAHSYYRQAITLFRQMEDRNRLISSLGSLSLCGPSLQTNTMVPANTRIKDLQREGEAAIKLAREIGKRPDEAFVGIMLVFSFGIVGEYSQALAIGEEALAIGEEIEHRQWITAANYALGTIYLEMLDLQAARQHLEQALTMAQESGSRHWERCAAARLSRVYIALNNISKAQEILHFALDPDTNMQTLGQRLAWQSQAELTLALGDFASVITITDRLIKSAANVDSHGEPVIPEISGLKAQALAGLAIAGGPDGHIYALEAENAFLTTLLEATRQGLQGVMWRNLNSQIKLYIALNRDEDAGDLLMQARVIVNKLAGNIINKSQKETFLSQIKLLMPAPPPIARKRFSKGELDHLTAREIEVATLVAQGKSNRTIARQLVLSERTVETHIGNILGKLGLSSRVQLATWSVENDLRGPGK